MNIFGVSRICEYFLGSLKTELFYGSYLYILGCLLRSRYRMGIFFLRSLKFQIFLGMPDIPIFFFFLHFFL